MTTKHTQCSSRSGFWISKISRKVRVLKQSQSALLCSISHMTILFVFTRVMNVWNQSIQAFVTNLGPFVMERASLFTDHKISSRPILAKDKHFRTIWEHTCDNSPTDFISSSLKCWSSMHGVDTLLSCCVVLFANSQYRSTHFFAWPTMSWDHEEIRRFCGNRNFFCSPAEIRDSNMVL